MRVLVACEFSGVVREAFAKRGHDAWSCDLLPTTSPGKHIQGDVLKVLGDGWDLMIAHPPCTYLAGSGMHWTTRGLRDLSLTTEALIFVEALLYSAIPRICVENPVGILNRVIRKPDQIIQPYMFGHDASKKTCLWLKNLPELIPTSYVEPKLVTLPSGRVAKRWANQCPVSGQNKLPPSPDRWKLRSITYQGIADAFADQWGGLDDS